MAFVYDFSLNLLSFSSFLLFWLFLFEHKPLNFISFCWKFCLVCFFFYLPFFFRIWFEVLFCCFSRSEAAVLMKDPWKSFYWRLLNILDGLKLTICGPIIVETRLFNLHTDTWRKVTVQQPVACWAWTTEEQHNLKSWSCMMALGVLNGT